MNCPLSYVLTPETNVVLIHLCNASKFPVQSSMCIDYGLNDKDLPETIPWNNRHTHSIVEYYHQELRYTYDKSNDGQKTTQTIFQKDVFDAPWYMVGLREETLPPHRFPCTKDIAHKTYIDRTIYTLSNRLFCYLDTYPEEGIRHLYFRYQHSPNVDIAKHEGDLQRAIRLLKKSPKMQGRRVTFEPSGVSTGSIS